MVTVGYLLEEMTLFKRKENKEPKFYWIRETNFIRQAIKLLQDAIDATNGDHFLVYEQRYCIPDKYWEITIQYPGNKDVSWIEANSDKLIKAMREGDSINRSVKSILKQKERTIKVSYALCDDYNGKDHVVIIYWQRR